MAWDPGHYLTFGGERLRPGFDLMARIGAVPPGAIYDLGCGTGAAAALAERFPDHAVIGLDTSPEMLAKAAETGGRVVWQQGDIADWTPPEPAALIFSNAALQWVPDHDRLFPHLITCLAPSGVLAVQMPRNFDAPSHRHMRRIAQDGPWRDRLHPFLREDPVAAPTAFYRRLAPLGVSGIDLWETEYVHVLNGANPVREWTSSTGLRPLLECLSADERAAYLGEYDEALAAAYPQEPDGRTLFGFRRLFMIVRR
jgi:trans-aconitate 2-methyltransferase